jgi:hypothetical protein
MVSCSEFELEDHHFYVTQLSNELCTIFQQHKHTSLPLDYTAFESLSRLAKAKRVRSIDLLLPVWTFSSNALLNDHSVTYSYREKTTAELVVSSVASTFLPKHSYVEMAPPFLLTVCQTKDELPIRPIHSHLITTAELAYQQLQN